MTTNAFPRKGGTISLRLPRLLWWWLASGLLAHAAIIEVPPGAASAITRAFARAGAGDIVQLQAGVYSGRVDIAVAGRPERPIVILGKMSAAGVPLSIIDGGAVGGRDADKGAFRLTGTAWIVVEGIAIRNAWLHPIEIVDSSFITVRHCVIRGGQIAIQTSGSKAHHILVEGNHWSQAPEAWTELDWAEMHHGKLKHFNGSIYGGNGAGGAIIRFNTITDVYNGFRYYLGAELEKARQRQANIELYDNVFIRSRDNAIEPENFAWNHHYYHNRIDSSHAPISIDAVSGGHIHVYGNTGTYRDEGGAAGASTWTIYKFAPYQANRRLDAPLQICHNSFNYNTCFSNSSRGVLANDHVMHVNNAYLHRSAKSHLGLVDWAGKDCTFDHDISSRPFHPGVRTAGFEQNGMENTDPGFVDPAGGDFRLAVGSPAIDRGKVIDGFTLWYTGRAPDVGAFEGAQRVYGMPFRYVPPPGGALYAEKPRIVRVFTRDRNLAVFFSTTMDARTATKESFAPTADGRSLPVEAVRFPLPHVAVLELTEALPDLVQTIDIAMQPLPRGANGESASRWGADLRVVRIPQDAICVGAMSRVFPNR